MRGRNKTRQGVTLAELCVVMALISILGTCIVSFCVMTNNYVARLSTDRDVKEGLTFVNQALDIWVSAFDSDDYVIAVDGAGAELQARPVDGQDQVYRFCLTDTAIEGELPTGNRLRFGVSHLQSLSFQVLTKPVDANDARVLIYCTVTHDKPFAANGVTDTTVLVRSTRSMGAVPETTVAEEETP